MPTLSPQTTFNVQAEAPVERPSMLAALSGLVKTGLDALGDEIDSEDNLEQGLVNGLEVAQKLKDEGRIAEAHQMERRIAINYTTAGGDLSKPRVQTLIQQYTGKPAEAFGFSPEEIALQQVLDPSTDTGKKFNTAYLATYATDPGISEEERFDLALSLIQKEAANDTLIQESRFHWSAGTQAAYQDKISSFSGVLLGGMVVLGQQGGMLTREDAQSARAQLLAFRAEIEASRPSNISNDQWAPIQNQLDALDAQVEYWEEILGPDNISANAASNLMREINNLPINDPKKNILTRMVMHDETLFANMGALGGDELFTHLRSMIDATPIGHGKVANSQYWDDVATKDDGSKRSPQEHFDAARSAINLVNGTTADLKSNEDLRMEWARAGVRGLSHLLSMHEDGDWLTGEEYASMFSDEYFDNLESIKDVDPGAYEALRSRTVTATNQAALNLNARMSSRFGDTPFEYNITTGQFRITENSVRNVVSNPAMSSALHSAVTEHYGGDYNAALADNGAAIYDSGNRSAASAWDRVVSAGGVPTTLKTMGTALTALNEVLQRAGGLEAAGRGTPQNTAMHNLIDRFESSGSYDTLFAHSEKPGGPFAGLQVSQMTLGELYEFSDPSGEGGTYGHYVKANNPKGDLATPMGRYQIVGTTLRQTAKEMDLPSNVIFTPEVQDAMFFHLVSKALRGKTSDADKRRAVRKVWDGFNSRTLTNEELTRAINEFEQLAPPTLVLHHRGDD